MIIVRHRIVFFAITGIITLVALASLAFYGLQLGTDFTGGSLVEVRYDASGRRGMP